MSNRQFHLSALSISLDADSVKNEAHLLPASDFVAHGVQQRINAEIAQKVIEKFALKKNQTVVDYEHQSLLTAVNGKPVIAAGWFDQLEWRPNGLYATNVSWTAAAREYLQKQEYRYVSAVYLYDAESGEVLEIINFALTNSPELDGLEALSALSNDQLRQLGDFKMSTSDTAALNKQMATLQTNLEAEQAKVAALTTEKAALSQELASAQKRADDLEAEKTQAAEAAEKKQHAELLQTALSDGKLIPAQKEWAEGLSLQSLTNFLDAAPVVVDDARQSGRKEDIPNGDGLTKEELAMCSQMQIDPKDFAKTKAAQAAA